MRRFGWMPILDNICRLVFTSSSSRRDRRDRQLSELGTSVFGGDKTDSYYDAFCKI